MNNEAKLESAYSFMLKYSKITVCYVQHTCELRIMLYFLSKIVLTYCEIVLLIKKKVLKFEAEG